jgi:hypothetical protein
MRNTDPRRPVELVGVYIGAANLEGTGYVFVSDIAPGQRGNARPPAARAGGRRTRRK